MWGKSVGVGPDVGRAVGKKENNKHVMAPNLGSRWCGRRGMQSAEDSSAGFFSSCPARVQGFQYFPMLPFPCAPSRCESYPVTAFSTI